MRNYQSKILSLQTNTGGKEKGRGVRFLYSPVSRILTIHYLHLIPYQNSDVPPLGVFRTKIITGADNLQFLSTDRNKDIIAGHPLNNA